MDLVGSGTRAMVLCGGDFVAIGTGRLAAVMTRRAAGGSCVRYDAGAGPGSIGWHGGCLSGGNLPCRHLLLLVALVAVACRLKFQFTGESEVQGAYPKDRPAPGLPHVDEHGGVLQLYAGELGGTLFLPQTCRRQNITVIVCCGNSGGTPEAHEVIFLRHDGWGCRGMEGGGEKLLK